MADPAAAHKKRRLRGSCDSCAHRKIKCDSAIVGIGRPCSNCVSFNTECTHTRGGRQDEFTSARTLVNAAGKNQKLPDDPGKKQEAIQELIAYARHLERDNASLRKNVSASFRMQEEEQTSPQPESYVPSTERTSLSPGVDELEGEEKLAQDVISGNRSRFFGNSSNVTLVRSAFEQLNIKDVPDFKSNNDFINSRRARFWGQPAWDGPSYETPPVYQLPPDDLLYSLIDLYFIYINPYMQLLHRPYFMRSVGERLWERNHHFGALLLSICALAARHSKDPRCFWEGDLHSAGCQWFKQIKLTRESFWEPVSLFELQMYCVAICYVHDSASHGSCWTLAAMGIRLAQDVGVHRSRGKPDAVTEMWRRVYWVLIEIDTIIAASFGRPRATTAQDHDLDMIQEVDDEFWEHPTNPELNFKQPEGRPSGASYQIAFIKLFDILGYAQRTLYASRKPITGDPQAWTQQILAELDSALEKWKMSLPDHLKWDPNNQDILFFNQSAYLHTALAFVQIQIHRPFIPAHSRKSPFAFPALTSCLNAARSCCHIKDAQMKRNEFHSFPQDQISLLSSGIVMILHLWRQRKVGLNTDKDIDLKDIQTIMDLLKRSEDRFMASGRFYDMLEEMCTEGNIEQDSPVADTVSRKRRNEEVESDAASPLTNISTPASSQDGISNDFATTGQPSIKTADRSDPYPDYNLFSLPLFAPAPPPGNYQQEFDPTNSFGSAMSSVMTDKIWDPFAAGWELDTLAQTVHSNPPVSTNQVMPDQQGHYTRPDLGIDFSLLSQPLDLQNPLSHPHMAQFFPGTATFQYR